MKWMTFVFLSWAAILPGRAQAPEPSPADSNRPQLKTPPYAQGRVSQLAFLRDGRTLMTQDGQAITLWDSERGLIIDTLSGGDGAPNALLAARLLPDRRFLWLHNPSSLNAEKRDLEEVQPYFKRVATVAIANADLLLADALDSTLLYRNRIDGVVSLTPATEKAAWQRLPSAKGTSDAAVLNPQKSTAAIGNFDGHLLMYDYAANRTIFDVAIPDTVITQTAFSPDGTLVATVAHPKSCFEGNPSNTSYLVRWAPTNTCKGKPLITVRNAETGKEVYSAALDLAFVVAFSPDARQIAVGGPAKIQLIDFGSKALIREIPLTRDAARRDTGSTYFRLAFSPDGRHLAETSLGPIHILEVSSGREIRALADPPEIWLSNSRLTSTGRLIGAVSRNNRIVVSEYSPGVSSRILKTDSPPYGRPIFSADGSTLATSSSDKSVRVWNVDHGTLGCKAPAAYNMWSSWEDKDLSADGSQLVMPGPERDGAEQGIEVWDVRSCRKNQTIVANSEPVQSSTAYAFAPPQLQDRERYLRRVARVAISPNHRYLSWVTVGNVLHIWNLAEQRFVASVRLAVPAVYSDRDSAPKKITNHLKAGDALLPVPENSLSNEEWLRFDQLAGGISGINFSPDDSKLAVLDFDGVTRVLSAENGRELMQLGTVPPEGTAFITNNNLFPATFGTASMAFSPDGKIAVTMLAKRNAPMVWDLATGKALHPIKGFRTYSSSANFTPDGRTLVTDGGGGYMLVADVATGEGLARVGAYGDGTDWLVSSFDGLFDGTAAAYQQLSWSFPGKRRAVLPMEAFFADFFRPGLLPDLLSGQRVHASKDLLQVDRRQARVQVEVVQPAAPGVAFTSRNVALRIRVYPPDSDESHQTSGVIRDLRLFRNGSLVRFWHGMLKPGAQGVVEVAVTVPAVAGPNEFVAYSFNQDNVESSKGVLFLDGARSLARKGIAYVIVAGVNQYENPEFNLRYAVTDARLVGDEFAANLESTHQYAKVNVVPLLDGNATKTNLLNVLIRLSGGVAASVPDNLGTAQPEDSVFIFFAGHGWAREGSFYLIPHDLGYGGQRTRLAADKAAQQTIVDHAISDRDVAAAVENIDAGQIAMVIDACNSGQLLESEESRQGPFNSKGLAQLAWDKGMFILTAAQSYQAALEDSQLQHGYLTYALIEEGLKLRKADRDPEDGQIEVRELFAYASGRVPEIQRERFAQARLLVREPAAAVKGRPHTVAGPDVQTPRAFYRTELNRRFLVAGLPPAKSMDCSLEPSLKSVDGKAAVAIDFQNATSSIRKIYWLDHSGNRMPYQTLAPGAAYRQNSLPDHLWVITDASEKCLAIYAPGDQGGSVTIR